MSPPEREGRSTAAPSRMTAEVKRLFLETLARHGTVKSACETVGVTRWDAKKERAADPEFDRLWTEATEEAADVLEAEAFRRAVEGFELKTTIKRSETKRRGAAPAKKQEGATAEAAPGPEADEKQGEMVSVAHKFSDGLLVLLLRANRPEKFGGRMTMVEAAPEDEMARDTDPPLIERGCAT